MNGKKVKIMDNEMIAGTEAFLRQTFADSAYFGTILRIGTIVWSTHIGWLTSQKALLKQRVLM